MFSSAKHLGDCSLRLRRTNLFATKIGESEISESAYLFGGPKARLRGFAPRPPQAEQLCPGFFRDLFLLITKGFEDGQEYKARIS